MGDRVSFRLTDDVPVGEAVSRLLSIGAKASKLNSAPVLKDHYYLISFEPSFTVLYLSLIGRPIDLVVTTGQLDARIEHGTAWEMKPGIEREPGNPEKVSVYVKEAAEEGGGTKASFKILNSGEVAANEEARVASEYSKLIEKQVKVMFIPVYPFGRLTSRPGWRFAPREGEGYLRGATSCLLIVRANRTGERNGIHIEMTAARTQFNDGEAPLWFGRGYLGTLLERLKRTAVQRRVRFVFDLQRVEA